MIALLGIVACQEKTVVQGPDDVLRQFVIEMRQVHGDVEAGARAVSLMWKPARDNLAERARRASALSGRELKAAEMVVPSWFALRLGVDEMEVHLDGQWADVVVSGARGESTHTRLKHEQDGWKVALELPALAPIRQREKPD